MIVSGKISVFRLYGYPAPAAIGADDVQKAKEDEENLIAHPTVLYQVKDDKLKEKFIQVLLISPQL